MILTLFLVVVAVVCNVQYWCQRERGFRVFVAPEAATMLFINGASVNDFARPESAFAFQQFVINSQMTLEDSLHNYAQSLSQDTVILCDRGVMDGR